jgi:HEAT repeat protein
MAIDWRAIADQVGDLKPDGTEKGSCTESGIQALELVLGEENIRGAVDCWASGEPGAFTAEMVLRIIRSTVAMNYCYEIYKSEPNTRRSGAAVFLLYEMADRRVLPWVAEFLEDANMDVRWNGVMSLQNILSGPLDDVGIASAKKLLAKAQSDADEKVRQLARKVHVRLASDPSLRHLGL